MDKEEKGETWSWAIGLTMRVIRHSISTSLEALRRGIPELAILELERALVDLRFLESLLEEGEEGEEK